jgi:myo-inositol 2-dehydrogenase/D-chiro-inositol 1-dehydrogenase
VRLGLIGLGRIGAFHTNTLVGIPAIDSLVVTDIVPEKTKHIVERFASQGVEGVDSLDALLASGVDGVIIAAGTDAHTKLILACVAAGLPTLCEKPVAPSGAEGAELLRRLDGSGVPVQIGFQRRYDAAIAAAKAAVDSGELGWIATIRSTTLDPEPPTPEYVAVSGGMYRDCGVHDFDIIRWISGREAVEVYATGSNQGADFFRDYDDVDTSAAIVTFANGTLGVVSNIRADLHPHVGTMIENTAEVQRVLDGSSIALCLDTGHLLIGGTDPAELSREAPERIAHVHFKDVDAAKAQQVRDGRYLTEEPAGEGPVADVRTSADKLRAVLRSTR